jgi:hypothetical protein
LTDPFQPNFSAKSSSTTEFNDKQNERRTAPMLTEHSRSAAAVRATELIDSKRSNAAYAHPCAGFDCAACSWRTDDLDEIAGIIDRETNYPELLSLLEYFDNLRREVLAAMRSKSPHPLASFHENGNGKQLYAITVPIGIFDRIRTALEHHKPANHISGVRFLLRPLRLPEEAHSNCSKCENGALMARESGVETSYLCYLHVTEVVLQEEITAAV